MFVSLWILLFPVALLTALECEYSSREFQVVLQPELLLNSFESGVTQVLDELNRIEDAQIYPFKLARSSLKFKNESLVFYRPAHNRAANDFVIPIKFKSRRKKPTEPADIVMKFSNADPAITCVPLTVTKDYVNATKIKFELDIHGENGRLRPQSAHSFATDLPMAFDQTSGLNLSAISSDAAAKFTYSKEPLILIPDAFGKITMRTAVFNIYLAGQKVEAAIEHYRETNVIKAEFAFRVKGATVDREVLLTAQRLVIELSQKANIALYAVTQPQI